MSILRVISSIRALDSPIAVGPFVFFIGDISDQPNAKILQYYSGYEDMVVSPLMLDAFEHDVETFLDEVTVWANGERQSDPLAYVAPLIATARERHASVWIMGD